MLDFDLLKAIARDLLMVISSTSCTPCIFLLVKNDYSLHEQINIEGTLKCFCCTFRP